MAIGQSNQPGSSDSATDLIRVPVLPMSWELRRAVDPADDEIRVDGPVDAAPTNGLIQVGDEWVTYAARDGRSFAGCLRGRFQADGGRPPLSHPVGTVVRMRPGPIHHRVLVDHLLATQSQGGGGGVSLRVREGSVTLVAAADTLDFDAAAFNLTDLGGSDVGIALNYGTGAGSVAEGNDPRVVAAGTHAARTDNPHATTKSQVGLGNVDDTSDAAKNAAVSTLTGKTLTAPVIADLSNAGHGHAAAASGGQLTDAALSAPVGIAKGGTGQTGAVAAFDALAPTTTQGDLIYHNGTDNVRLPKGTGLQGLRMNAGATAPEWAAAGGGGGAAALDDLSDVAIAAPAAGHILRRDATQFVNAFPPIFVTLGPFLVNDLPAAAATVANLLYFNTATAVNQGGAAGSDVRMDRAGAVVGAFINADAARTAGTATVQVRLNTVATALMAGACALDATQTQRDSAFDNAGLAFAAGDRIGVAVVTVGWAPITANAAVFLVVRLEPFA